MTFHANSKLLNFTEKLKKASGKWRINMVTWSILPYAVNVTLILYNIDLGWRLRQTANVRFALMLFCKSGHIDENSEK